MFDRSSYYCRMVVLLVLINIAGGDDGDDGGDVCARDVKNVVSQKVDG